MTDATYKPPVTFTWTAGQSISSAIHQNDRHALIAVQSPNDLRGLGASPAGAIYIQFLGSFTETGTFSLIKNDYGIVAIEVKSGKGYSHPIEPADFAGFPYVKAQVVGVKGGSGIPQLATKTMTGKLYEV